MAFLRGKSVRVFITTENGGGGVILTGSSPDSTSTSVGIGSGAATLGIGRLGQLTTSSNTTDLVPFVEGIDISKGWEDENSNFFNTQKEYHIPQRKRWEVTITRKSENTAFSLLASGARHGVTGSASGALHSGLTEMLSSSGYRIYLYDGTKWDVQYHGVIPADGYTEKMDPVKSKVESIKFVGNEWSTSLGDAAIAVGQAQE